MFSLLNSNVVVSYLHSARGVDVSDEDRKLQLREKLQSAHGNYQTGHDAVTGIMSKYDVGSSVAELNIQVFLFCSNRGPRCHDIGGGILS